jgi:phenylalanyl-tRNA synthetase beta chain
VKISLDWLKELVSWDDTPEDLAAVDRRRLNVESIEEFEQSFPKVVIAKVVQREQHPDADRLSLCQVDDGSGEPVQVVCGAPNVREGLTVLFARVGAVLPGDFKIKKSKIRGVESFGMICSANELELTGDSEGIMELDTDLPPGTPADELYGFKDTVLDIEVTPNRPDWLSHFGVAREVAAIYGTKASMPRSGAASKPAKIWVSRSASMIMPTVPATRLSAPATWSSSPRPTGCRTACGPLAVVPSATWWTSPTTCSSSWGNPCTPSISPS